MAAEGTAGPDPSGVPGLPPHPRLAVVGAGAVGCLIDFVEGREVEIDAIWGEPLRRARAAGLEMPRLGMLRDLIASAVARRPSAEST